MVGETTADGSGAWSITTSFLADGTYTITAFAVDRNGVSMAMTQLHPTATENSLVIDTVGPKVTGVFLDRLNGRIQTTFQDDRSGLDRRSFIDGADYSFTKRLAPRTAFLISRLSFDNPDLAHRRRHCHGNDQPSATVPWRPVRLCRARRRVHPRG